MTTGVTSTSYDYNAAMDNIQAEVEAYCEANGINAEDYLSNLDGNLTINVFDNPTLAAYFQLAYMQLVEMLYPEVINSIEAEVGAVDFATLYESCDEEFNAFITSIIQDDPELMALFSMQAGSSDSEIQALYAELAKMISSSDSEADDMGATFYTDQARDSAAGTSHEDFVNWLADQEDMFTSVEMSILDQLSTYDQAILEIKAALENDDISAEEFQAEMENIMFGRETLMTMLQQVTAQKSQFFEMISEMMDKATEMQNSIINNMRSY
ncbi:MAG: hypothetical protein ABII18_11600 [bacterium]|nr:hypothetical protein [bacterium]MBU1917043.1 hypothetical protein [bacterium]